MNPAESLGIGRQAAFHGAPVVGIAPLQALLTTDPDAAQRDEATWLLAVCQGASGLYGSALATTSTLDETSPFAGRLHLVAGSVHRQLGNFDIARRHDAMAAASAVESVACEAQLGLAADAVGSGDAEAATEHLARAHDLWQPPWWREGIRLQWVSAEVALINADAPAAIPGLRAAEAVAREHEAPRHVAKTQGFLAVALRSAYPGDAERRAECLELLAAAIDAAQALAAWPLVWAFGRLQWQWLAEDPNEEQAARMALDRARRAVSLIVSDLPDEMRPAFRRRPDVGDLLG